MSFVLHSSSNIFIQPAQQLCLTSSLHRFSFCYKQNQSPTSQRMYRILPPQNELNKRNESEIITWNTVACIRQNAPYTFTDRIQKNIPNIRSVWSGHSFKSCATFRHAPNNTNQTELFQKKKKIQTNKQKPRTNHKWSENQSKIRLTNQIPIQNPPKNRLLMW